MTIGPPASVCTCRGDAHDECRRCIDCDDPIGDTPVPDDITLCADCRAYRLETAT